MAADPQNTAVATLEWDDGRARLVREVRPAEDDVIAEVVRGAGRVGVDCPFGWPVGFVEFVRAFEDDRLAPPPDSCPEWRRALSLRATDRWVRESGLGTPLSVSTDRIAVVTMRWAAIASRLRVEGLEVPRDGSGPAAEVYPAAALRRWGLPHRGLKGAKNAVVLLALVDEILRRAPWLDLGEWESSCRTSDHVVDAVLCALVARAVDLGLTTPPSEHHHDLVRREGWIHVPTCDLEALRPASP